MIFARLVRSAAAVSGFAVVGVAVAGGIVVASPTIADRDQRSGIVAEFAQLPAGISADDVASLNTLLGERAAAVRAGDTAAHAATIDEDASGEFREVEGRTVTAAAEIGLERYEESLYLPVVDLTPPGGETHSGVRAVTLEVRRVHRIAGYDDRDHVGSLYLTFVERSQGWRVLEDGVLSPIGLASERELWELYDSLIERRERVLVVGTASPARLRQIADLLDRALTQFDTSWVEPWSGRVVVIVPASTLEVEALLQPTIDISKFVAFTTLGIDRSEGWNVVAPRIVAQEANLGLRSAQQQVKILIHELAHAASVTTSGPATPLWLHEGLAEWVTANRPATTGEKLVLPDLHRFRSGSISDIREVYDQAASTMSQLAGTFGDSAPWHLFRGVGEATRSPGTADHVLDTVLRQVTGSGLEELTR